MSDSVKIYHPITKATSVVAPSAVRIWQLSGWRVVIDEPAVVGEHGPEIEIGDPKSRRKAPQTPAVRPDTEDAGASEANTTDKE